MTVSRWAVPCDADAAAFVPVIARLAAAVGAPVFDPHITVGSDFAGAAPFTVALTALADSDLRFRCITVTAAAPQLHAVAQPHLSLLYAELGPAERAALRASVELALPMTITVDAIWDVDTSGDVSEWRVVNARKLGTAEAC